MCDMHKQMEIHKKENREVEISTELCKKVIRETCELGTRDIIFLGGEPFMREDIFELVRYAQSFGLNTVLITNGVLMNERNVRACFDSGVKWLSISIDAATEKTFQNIRGQNILKTILQNIHAINEIKKERGGEFPKIVIVCTVMNDNLEELVSLVDLCRDLRAEKLLFQPVVACNVNQAQREKNFTGAIPPERLDVLDHAIDGLIARKKSSPSDYDFLGNSVKRLEWMKKYFRGCLDPKKLPCYAGYNRLQITQEGKIYFCVNENQHKAVFGDIRQSSLRELWYSKQANQYRKMIKKCQTPCLQLCSERGEFVELAEQMEKIDLFGQDEEG